MDPVFDLCHLVAILPFSFPPRARRSAMNKHLIQVQPQSLPPPTKKRWVHQNFCMRVHPNLHRRGKGQEEASTLTLTSLNAQQ